MIRDLLTIPLVCLSLFGTAAQQEGDNPGLQLLAATGDTRRTMVRFLDLYAGLKAGVAQCPAGMEARAGCSDLLAES